MTATSTTSKLTPRYRSVNETQLTQDQFDLILCPNLRTGVRMSLIEPDSDGWVRRDQLKAFLNYVGVAKRTVVEFLLIDTAVRAPNIKRKGFINILSYHDTFLDHGSSSGIFNNPEGFSAERLALLLGYENPQGRFYLKDLAPALNRFHQCPFKKKSAKGTNILSFEFAGLLAIYGRFDRERGQHFFTADDIEALWLHNHFPEGWQAPEKPYNGTWSAFRNYCRMVITRLKIGWKNLGQPQIAPISTQPTPAENIPRPASTSKQAQTSKDEEPII